MTKFRKGSSSTSFWFNGSSVKPVKVNASEATPESFGTLQSLITSAGEGGTLDLGSRLFQVADETEATTYRSGLSLPNDLTISGGTIEGAIKYSSFTDEGGGVYSIAYPGLPYDDVRMYINDPDAANWPLFQVRPLPPTGVSEYCMSRTPDWYELTPSEVSVDGSNYITGVTISGSAKTAFDSLLNGSSVDGQILCINSDQNLLDYVEIDTYDSGTGVIVLAETSDLRVISATVAASIAFHGFPESLNAGEWCVVKGTVDKIYYKPSSGSVQELLVPAIHHVLGNSSGLTLEDCTIRYNARFSVDNRPALVYHRVSNADADLLTIARCTFEGGWYGLNSYMTSIVDSEAHRFVVRFGSVYDGTTVYRSKFTHTEELECFQVGRDTLAGSGYTLRPSVFQDCYFSNPGTTHGQGISGYQDSWQSMTIEHNVFYNCKRALSLNGLGGAQTSSFNGCTIRNNLIYWDIADISLTGQSSVHFGGPDTHLSVSEQVLIEHNTIMISPSADDTYDQRTGYSTRLANLTTSDVRFGCNCCGEVMSSDGGVTTQQSNFIFFSRASSSGWSAADLLYNGELADLDTDWDATNLLPLNEGATGAPDGGIVGIRWTSMPTASDLATLPRTWYLDYPADSFSITYENETAQWGVDARDPAP